MREPIDLGHIRYQPDDGGREAAGFRGQAGDCAVRAAAIATGLPYREVYDQINLLGRKHERRTKSKDISNSRTGVYRQTMHRLMESVGAVWTPTMHIGSGCTVHLRAEELPAGRLVLSLSRHYAAVIDGVLHDTHDSSRGGVRCCYGFWEAP